ncbi:hypothetical protein EGW08_011114 [Elysia chlorotica]|uniref:G-protein coupled receptors family 1 profile domain-containing protein n=1 Tax=Elysia chlorotica TaxID=188477 RepID=A0A3S1A2N8_ELYCH|nr:hypothetical protein EGW08_011114 [Elysia chlorotica]
MKIYLFVAVEFSAVVLNLAFTIVVWTRTSVGEFLRVILMGLVFVNLMTNAQCMALDLSMAVGIYLGWPICFSQFVIAPFCIYATLLLVTVINTERIVAIKWPLSYQTYFTKVKATLVLFVIFISAMALTLVGLPDLLRQYERSVSVCLPTDLYPRRYATYLISATCSFLLLVVLLSFMVNVRVLLAFKKHKLARVNQAPSHATRKMTRSALVASRIAFASAFLYTWSIGFMVTFLFWMSIYHCDDMCLSEGNFSVAAALVQLMLTFQDPLVFFISIVKWSSLKRRVLRLCGAFNGSNQVAPSSSHLQGSSQPQTSNLALSNRHA